MSFAVCMMNLSPGIVYLILKKAMFYSTIHFPRLHTKAAETACLLHVIKEISLVLKDPTSEHDAIRHHGLEALCTCDRIVRQGADFFDEATASELLTAVAPFLLAQNWLMKDSMTNRTMLYFFSVKMH